MPHTFESDDFPLKFKQGTKWIYAVEMQNDDDTPINNTGFTSRFRVRDSHDDAAANVLEITNVANADGRIVIGGANGMFTLEVEETKTATLEGGTYFYDWFYYEPDGDPLLLLSGKLTIRKSLI